MATHPMSAASEDLVAILKRDHLLIDELFGQYGHAENDAQKLKVVTELWLNLMPHAKAEEEVVYPAIRDAGDDEGFVEQLYDEQAAAEKTLLSILRGDPDDMTYDMKVKMLQKAIQSHVREEETIMVQQAVDAGLDLVALGRDFDRRKQELKPVFERQLSEFRK